VELEPAHAKHFCFRGGVKSDYNDSYGGIGDFTKAVELDSNIASAYFKRAVAFLGITRHWIGNTDELLYIDFQV
jgi:hypothetical protein